MLKVYNNLLLPLKKINQKYLKITTKGLPNYDDDKKKQSNVIFSLLLHKAAVFSTYKLEIWSEL